MTIIDYKIQNSISHNSNHFTQGLVFSDSSIFESTGLFGESKLIKYNLNYLALDSIILPIDYFGEGVTILNNKIYQLTWQNHKILIYDLHTFKFLEERYLDLEGWGICTDGNSLIISNGSNYLFYYSIPNIDFIKKVKVSDGRNSINLLNELEFIDGHIFANKWYSNLIYIIDPISGIAKGKLDLKSLAVREGYGREGMVLNGIAFKRNSNILVLTGKYYKHFYEIELDTRLGFTK